MIKYYIIENIEFFRLIFGLLFLVSCFISNDKPRKSRLKYFLIFISSFSLSVIYDYQKFIFFEHMFSVMCSIALIMAVASNKQSNGERGV